MKQVLLALGIIGLALPAHADQTYDYADCTYRDLTKPTMLYVHGPCKLITATINGHFGFTLAWPQSHQSVKVEETSRMGQDRTWIINGRPGTAFEVNREHVEGATLDKQITVTYHVKSDSP